MCEWKILTICKIWGTMQYTLCIDHKIGVYIMYTFKSDVRGKNLYARFWEPCNIHCVYITKLVYTSCIHQKLMYASCIHQIHFVFHNVQLMYTTNIHSRIGVHFVYTLCVQIVYKMAHHFGKGLHLKRQTVPHYQDSQETSFHSTSEQSIVMQKADNCVLEQ